LHFYLQVSRREKTNSGCLRVAALTNNRFLFSGGSQPRVVHRHRDERQDRELDSCRGNPQRPQPEQAVREDGEPTALQHRRKAEPVHNYRRYEMNENKCMVAA